MIALAAQKLKSTQGFMLAEQLLSIIFIGLLCIAIAAGMGAALTAFANVSRTTESQALLNRSVQEVSDELAYSRDPNTDGTFVSESIKVKVRLVNVTNGTQRGIALQGTGISAGNISAGSETVLLIPESDGLTPNIDGITYNPSNNTWKYTIKIMQGSNELASTTMTVARVGN